MYKYLTFLLLCTALCGAAESDVAMNSITEEAYRVKTQSTKIEPETVVLTVTLYSHAGCAPCVWMRQRLHEIHIKFEEVDMYSKEAVDMAFECSPCVVVRKDGVEVFRQNGSCTAEEMRAKLLDTVVKVSLKDHCLPEKK